MSIGPAMTKDEYLRSNPLLLHLALGHKALDMSYEYYPDQDISTCASLRCHVYVNKSHTHKPLWNISFESRKRVIESRVEHWELQASLTYCLKNTYFTIPITVAVFPDVKCGYICLRQE